MNKVFNFFLENVNEDEKSINFLKAETLVVSLIFIVLIALIVAITNLLSQNIGRLIISITILFTVLPMLVIIKRGNYQFVGNLLSYSFALILIYSMLANPEKLDILYFFVVQYYTFFVIIIFSAMFGNRITLIINTIAIFISTSYIYNVNKDLIPDNIKDISSYGFFIYEIMTLFSFALMLVFTFFISRAIKNLSEKSEKIEIQNRSFKSLSIKVKESAGNLTSASSQLSTASEQISQRANEQAATTEELASAIEQITETINFNAEKAEITGEISSKSAKKMKQGSEVFRKTIKSVTEVSEKITIISEIANKTDILSINAAIEAARAGESGKGFSVIANEIRKLADKTKNASGDINKLSETGKTYSQITDKLFEKLIPEILKSAEHVTGIVSSSKEQQRGIGSINISIQQLTEIANENSASAEEMSASAEELLAQAEQLKELISGFESGKFLKN